MKKLLVAFHLILLIFGFSSIASALNITIDYTQRQLLVGAYVPSGSVNSDTDYNMNDVSSEYNENIQISDAYYVPADDEFGQQMGMSDYYGAFAYASQYSSVITTGSEVYGEVNGYVFGYGGFQEWWNAGMGSSTMDLEVLESDWEGYVDFVLQFTIDEEAIFSIDSAYSGDGEATVSLYSATSPYDEIFNISNNYVDSLSLALGSYSFKITIECNDNFSTIEEDMLYDILFNITEDTSSGIAPVPEPTTMLLLGSGLVGLAGFRRKFKK